MNIEDDKVDEFDLNLITSYVVMTIHTLSNSATELTPRNIRSEVKMFYEKFGNKEVERLANLIMEVDK